MKRTKTKRTAEGKNDKNFNIKETTDGIYSAESFSISASVSGINEEMELMAL